MSPRVYHRFIMIVILHLTLLSHANALDSGKAAHHLMFDSWGTHDGLPQRSVTGIAQSPDGYLWFGTLEGLVRFDGRHFRQFSSRTTSAFSNNAVAALLSDSRGRLWVGFTDGGLVRQVGGVFEALVPEEGGPTTRISSLVEDISGTIWLGTAGRGLLRYDGERFTRTSGSEDWGATIHALAADGSTLWLATDRGLLSATVEDDRSIGSVVRYAEGLQVLSVVRLDDGRVLFGTTIGLFQLKNNSVTFLDALNENAVVSLSQGQAGTVWVGTDGDGLYRARPQGDQWFYEHFATTDDSVISLLVDDVGSLWVGTNLGGLNRYSDSAIVTFTRDDGLGENFTRSVYEDSRGDVWIGSENGGVTRYRNGLISAVPEFSAYASASIFAILETSDGVLWFGTDRGLLSWRDGKVALLDTTDGLSSDIVLSLAEGADGSLWVGTYQGGVNQVRDGVPLPKPASLTALDSYTINVLLPSGADELWIGTRGQGLFHWHGGRLDAFTTESGLTSDMVFALFEDRKGDLWVGTYGGGLNRLHGTVWQSVTEQNGLFDNVVHRLIDDARGRLWMSSNRGISSVPVEALDAVLRGERSTLKVDIYGLRDGMSDAECNGGSTAGTMTADGYLWFPTAAGLVRVDPSARATQLRAGSVFVEAVAIDGVEVSTTAFDLAPGTAEVQIGYTATQLTRPDQVMFRYRLEGYDDDWIETIDRREVTYSKLAAGAYVFALEASLNGGPWQRAEQNLRFSVAPRFYETLWFYALLLLCVFMLSVVSVRLKASHLRTRNTELAELVAIRTQELEAANSRLEKLAHEDGLTGLLNRRAFDYMLDIECRRARRSGIPFSVLLLDVDYFKAFNDGLGHQAGDECLREIASLLKAACNRAGEAVARYGGEEIAIILPSAGCEQALDRAEQLRQGITDLAMEHPASKVSPYVSVSVGVVCSAQLKNISSSALIERVDAALYRAKDGGRNQVAAALQAPIADPMAVIGIDKNLQDGS